MNVAVTGGSQVNECHFFLWRSLLAHDVTVHVSLLQFRRTPIQLGQSHDVPPTQGFRAD